MKYPLPSQTERRSPAKNEIYATPEEFQRLFAAEMTEFFRLALHLTANAEQAKDCLILAIRDCLESSSVAKPWASIWARRMIVRNGVRAVLGAEQILPDDFPLDAVSEFPLQPVHFRLEGLQESTAVLALPSLDRLVFVICVLERYSTVDCALLLKKSPKDVCDARLRATHAVRSFDIHSRLRPAVPLGSGCGEIYGGRCDSDGSCGTILD